MRKNTPALPARSYFVGCLSAVLLLVCLAALPAAAQPPTDSLNGKTIHIYVESDNFNNFWFQNNSIPLKKDSKYNYSLTISGVGLYIQDFFFTSNGTDPVTNNFKWKFGRTGLNETTEGRFTVADFAGKSEIWIVVDPADPVTAPPKLLFEAPKTINILNPWITTAPVLIHDGKTRLMTTTPGRCGWFTTLILDPALTKGYFSEVNKTDTYGKGGQPSIEDYDFSALFTTHASSSIWLNTQANTWTKEWPSVDGQCQYLMGVTVRDFSAEHPDFAFGNISGDHSVLNIAQPTINTTTRKPILNPANITKDPSISFQHFDEWWITDSTTTRPEARKNYESCYDIPMSKSSDGAWEYDSYRDSQTDKSFFPAEANNHHPAERVQVTLFDNSEPPVYKGSDAVPGVTRNGNFCIESHATFIYQPGQEFAFRGDDDVWVFINDRLVVDLGGIHIPKSKTVKLDTLNPKLKPDSTYKWDLFYCDRQPSGSSLRIKTSIFFEQKRALYGIKTPGPNGSISLDIWKRTGGTGNCASIGTTSDSTKATNLTYQVVNASEGVVKELLTGGVFYGGAINIATPKVTVDTSLTTANWETLTPGATYRVVAFEPTNPALKVYVPFTVPVRSYVKITSPALDTTAKLGELIRVIFGAIDNGLPSAQAIKYVPSPDPGLLVFSDAAGTIPAVIGSLMTNPDGFDTLWVTGTPNATTETPYKLSLPLPGNSRTFKFLLPKNRVEFEPLVPAPDYSREVPVGSVVTLNTANRENGAIVAKAESYTLNIPAGLKVFTDAEMTVPVITNVPITTDPTGLDVLYATADSTDPVTKKYELKIIGSGKTMTLTFVMPPLDLPKALSAIISDKDGDGIGDQITVAYDRDISAKVPDSISSRWPASVAAVAAPAAGTSVPNAAALAGLITGKDLVWTGRFSSEVRTDGEGLFGTTYRARGRDTTRNIPLLDGIGPVILSAKIFLGKTQDTLRIRFSEPTASAGITVTPGELFSFKRMSEGSAERIDPEDVKWNDGGTEVALVFDNTSASAPRFGNLVRIEDGAGRIADNLRNGAGPLSQYHVITGGKRSDIHRVTYREIAPEASLLLESSVKPSLQATNAEVAEVVERTGRMGHLIKTDLSGYAVQADVNKVDRSLVTLEYQVSYFTNFGLHVTGDKRVIACTDDLFKNDCLRNQGFVFVGWNYTSRDGARVATGAYVTRLNYQVKMAGKVVESNGLEEVWGILRKQ